MQAGCICVCVCVSAVCVWVALIFNYDTIGGRDSFQINCVSCGHSLPRKIPHIPHIEGKYCAHNSAVNYDSKSKE